MRGDTVGPPNKRILGERRQTLMERLRARTPTLLIDPASAPRDYPRPRTLPRRPISASSEYFDTPSPTLPRADAVTSPAVHSSSPAASSPSGVGVVAASSPAATTSSAVAASSPGAVDASSHVASSADGVAASSPGAVDASSHVAPSASGVGVVAASSPAATTSSAVAASRHVAPSASGVAASSLGAVRLPQSSLTSPTSSVVSTAASIELAAVSLSADEDSAEVPSRVSGATKPKRLSRKQLVRGGYSLKTLTALPPPPPRHPVTNWINHANPDESVDPDAEWEVVRLLDRRGKPPKLAYLADWKGTPHQFTWVWERDLGDKCNAMMDEVDRWKEHKARGGQVSQKDWFRRQGRRSGATASSTGLCFLEALQSAMCIAECHGKVTKSLWEAFAQATGKDYSYGVKKRDQVDFFRSACVHGAMFDFITATKNCLTTGITSVAKLETFVNDKLDPGVYIVHAGQDGVEHCFTLVTDGRRHPQVADCFDETKTTSFELVPLSNLKWIEMVRTIRRITPTSVSLKGRRTKRLKLH